MFRVWMVIGEDIADTADADVFSPRCNIPVGIDDNCIDIIGVIDVVIDGIIPREPREMGNEEEDEIVGVV